MRVLNSKMRFERLVKFEEFPCQDARSQGEIVEELAKLRAEGRKTVQYRELFTKKLLTNNVLAFYGIMESKKINKEAIWFYCMCIMSCLMAKEMPSWMFEWISDSTEIKSRNRESREDYYFPVGEDNKLLLEKWRRKKSLKRISKVNISWSYKKSKKITLSLQN